MIDSSLYLPISFTTNKLPTVIEKALIAKSNPKYSVSIPNCSMITIGELENLKYLYLGNNQLTHIPDSIGKLKSLKYLFLRTNFIVNIPESIESLSSLQYLNIERNNLKKFPVSLEKLEARDVKIFK